MDRSVASGNWGFFKKSSGIWIFSCIRKLFMKDAELEDDYKAASVFDILASIVFKKR